MSKDYDAPLQTMHFSRMESTPVNANPFHHDAYHMGHTIGGITIMYDNNCKHRFYIHNKATGERIRVHLTEFGKIQCAKDTTFTTVGDAQ